MNQITGALTRSYGPLPGYAWAGLIALGAFFVVPLLRGAGRSSSAASQGRPSSVYTAPSTSAVGPPGPPGAAMVRVWAQTYDQAQQWAAQGIPLYWVDSNGAVQNYTPGTSTGTPVFRLSPAPTSGGQGGASRSRSIGNRRAQLMSPHHPDLKVPVRYTQTLAAVGGPGTHTASVHAIAARAGVHPARLLALNPHYSGVIRIH